MRQLLVLFNVAFGKDFKSIFVKVTNHSRIGFPFLIRVVESGRAATRKLADGAGPAGFYRRNLEGDAEFTT